MRRLIEVRLPEPHVRAIVKNKGKHLLYLDPDKVVRIIREYCSKLIDVSESKRMTVTYVDEVDVNGGRSYYRILFSLPE